jgi:hypothetical protein
MMNGLLGSLGSEVSTDEVPQTTMRAASVAGESTLSLALAPGSMYVVPTSHVVATPSTCEGGEGERHRPDMSRKKGDRGNWMAKMGASPFAAI